MIAFKLSYLYASWLSMNRACKPKCVICLLDRDNIIWNYFWLALNSFSQILSFPNGQLQYVLFNLKSISNKSHYLECAKNYALRSQQDI
jgi:hypothetical protein